MFRERIMKWALIGILSAITTEVLMLLLCFLFDLELFRTLLELLHGPALLILYSPYGYTYWLFWIVNILYAILINGIGSGIAAFLIINYKFSWQNKIHNCEYWKIGFLFGGFALSFFYHWILLSNIAQSKNLWFFVPMSIFKILSTTAGIHGDHALGLILPSYWFSAMICGIVVFLTCISALKIYSKLS